MWRASVHVSGRSERHLRWGDGVYRAVPVVVGRISERAVYSCFSVCVSCDERDLSGVCQRTPRPALLNA